MTLAEAIAEYRSLYLDDRIARNNETLMGALLLMGLQSLSVVVELPPIDDEEQ